MPNTAAKNRVRQEDVDSDYLFGNCLQVPCLLFLSDPLKRKMMASFSSTPDVYILARFLLRHDQRTDATNLFRRPPAGWDGCCADSREAAVNIIAASRKIGLSIIAA
jgi:hypothetical protein